MNRETLIKILLFIAIIFIVILIIYYSVKLIHVIKDRKKQIISSPYNTVPESKFNSLVIADTSKSVQTQFFRESANHSLEVVNGKEPVPNQDIDYKGKDILETLRFMNDDARSNIYIAIQYMMVSRPDAEEQMRKMNYSEGIPMWMLIIRQAMLQTIPNIGFPSCSNAPLTVSFSKTA